MKIFAVVVTYNGEKWLDICFSSFKSSLIPIEVIVVDNASTDNTRQIIRKYQDIIYLPMQENLGFGKANNIGIRYALQQQADYILLLNQDAWIKEDVIQGLIDLSRKHSEYGVLSCVHLRGDGKALDRGFSLYTHLSEIPEKKGPNTLKPASFINAAIWLLPAPVFNRIGGFDPMFAHYGEDFDFVQRLHYHGYKVGYCPTLYGYHDRENRKEQTKFQHLCHEFIYFLNVAKNINLSYSRSWFKIYKEAIHNGIKNKQLSAYLKITAILRKNKKEIKESRELVKTPGNHFLSEEKICFKPLSYF